MLIDDSVTQLLNAKFTLQHAGFHCEIVSDTDQVMEKLVQAKPDMIITDLNMPKMDGISLIRSIRTLPEYLHTPVIIMSTDSQKHKFEEARQAGANGWLVKPVKGPALLETLNRFFPDGNP
jgi:two-component system chemotaxis response regulator CheY